MTKKILDVILCRGGFRDGLGSFPSGVDVSGWDLDGTSLKVRSMLWSLRLGEIPNCFGCNHIRY